MLNSSNIFHCALWPGWGWLVSLEFMTFLYFLYLLANIATSGGQFSRTLGMGAIQNENYLE